MLQVLPFPFLAMHELSAFTDSVKTVLAARMVFRSSCSGGGSSAQEAALKPRTKTEATVSDFIVIPS